MTLLPQNEKKLALSVLSLAAVVLLHVGVTAFKLGELVQKVDDVAAQMNKVEQLLYQHMEKER